MTAVDLFIGAGQSNSAGVGDSATSPAVTATAYDLTDGAVTVLDDPVGPADTGSMWPAFVNAIYATTGVAVAIVSTGVDGAALQAAAAGGGGDWSPTGERFGECVYTTERAIDVLEAAGYTVTLRGVVWCQGERDAQFAPSASDYGIALRALASRFRDWFGYANLPLYVIRTGTLRSGDNADWAAIRQAQTDVAAGDPNIIMAYTDCVNFAGYGWMSDSKHYTQTGYDDIGTDAAAVVLANLRTPAASVLSTGTPYIKAPTGFAAMSGATRT